VGDVLDYLGGGMSVAEVLEDFPDLAAEDIQACLSFAGDRKRGGRPRLRTGILVLIACISIPGTAEFCVGNSYTLYRNPQPLRLEGFSHIVQTVYCQLLTHNNTGWWKPCSVRLKNCCLILRVITMQRPLMRPHYILALATLISFAQPALSQSIQGFNLDIFEGDVIYQSGGGGTVLTASDLGTQFIMPADFANILVNGQFISGPSGGFVPGLQLSPYAQANMSLLTGVSDDYFINNAMVGEPGAFLDHNGNVTDYPNPFTDADQLALISSASKDCFRAIPWQAALWF
jgi:hypothetical protein